MIRIQPLLAAVHHTLMLSTLLNSEQEQCNDLHVAVLPLEATQQVDQPTSSLLDENEDEFARVDTEDDEAIDEDEAIASGEEGEKATSFGSTEATSDEAITLYLREIGRAPLLCYEQEMRLGHMIAMACQEQVRAAQSNTLPPSSYFTGR
ncbi:hypothetical protein KDA_51360 [Dictyobacter alpinus]|uniref:RNA polymerase sigma-70 region 1.2 domain-containing protein n=1 Tax=Dictyobacter alpinus TaxID=2014873 RepID=A0A402BED3_9CHLR|nr:sigma-70 factor domain-containing protein [Dictyobacter alpinus]GCE29652.1 hypothetical protein KDA_51360 [Dictyobacter alpinus]